MIYNRKVIELITKISDNITRINQLSILIQYQDEIITIIDWLIPNFQFRSRYLNDKFKDLIYYGQNWKNVLIQRELYNLANKCEEYWHYYQESVD